MKYKDYFVDEDPAQHKSPKEGESAPEDEDEEDMDMDGEDSDEYVCIY